MRKTQPMSQGCPCHGPGTGHFTDIFRLDPVPVKPGAWCSAHSGCHYAPAELSFLPMPSLCCPKRQLPPSASFWPCLLFNPRSVPGLRPSLPFLGSPWEQKVVNLGTTAHLPASSEKGCVSGSAHRGELSWASMAPAP